MNRLLLRLLGLALTTAPFVLPAAAEAARYWGD